MDPYAKSVGRPIKWSDEMFGYVVGDEGADLLLDTRDNAAFASLAAVVDPAFTWGTIGRYGRRGTTRSSTRCTCAASPCDIQRFPNTCAALTKGSHRACAEPFEELGVTAVELMPVHVHARDRHLEQKGLTNYWGYNSFGYFAPNAGSPRHARRRAPSASSSEWCAGCTRPGSR